MKSQLLITGNCQTSCCNIHYHIAASREKPVLAVARLSKNPFQINSRQPPTPIQTLLASLNSTHQQHLPRLNPVGIIRQIGQLPQQLRAGFPLAALL